MRLNFANQSSVGSAHGFPNQLPPGWSYTQGDPAPGFQSQIGTPPWWTQGNQNPNQPPTSLPAQATSQTPPQFEPAPAFSTPAPRFGDYLTGIQSGQIPQSFIDQQAAMFSPGSVGKLSGGPVMSPQQQSELQGRYTDVNRANAGMLQSDFNRQAAVAKSQLELQRDQARSGAANQAFGGMLGGYKNDIEAGLAGNALDRKQRDVLYQFLMGNV